MQDGPEHSDEEISNDCSLTPMNDQLNFPAALYVVATSSSSELFGGRRPSVLPAK